MPRLAFLVPLLLLASTSLVAADPPEPVSVTRHVVETAGYDPAYTGRDAAAFPDGFPLGIGSSLSFAGLRDDGAAILLALTDRGPNGKGPTVVLPDGERCDGKIFPLPDFAPLVVRIELDADAARLVSVHPILDRRAEGDMPAPCTGRPPPPGRTGATGEYPLDDALSGDPLWDPLGLDPEGLDLAPDGTLWIADEYGPFLLNVEAGTGRVLSRLAPGHGLPELLSRRRLNRGFEGLAVAPDGRIFAALQSPLDGDGDTVESRRCPWVRILEIAPATGEVRQYALPVDVATFRLGDFKIGDLAYLADDRLLLIEQGKTRRKGRVARIRVVDLGGAEDVGARNLERTPPTRPLVSRPLLDLKAHGWPYKKTEGLALSDDGRRLWVVNDNDFGMAVRAVADGAGSDRELRLDVDAEARVHALYRVAPLSREQSRTEIWEFRFDRDLRDRAATGP